MLGCAAPDVLSERRDRSPCHDPKLFTYARFLPPPLRSVSSASPTLGFFRLPYARFLPPPLRSLSSASPTLGFFRLPYARFLLPPLGSVFSFASVAIELSRV